MEALCPPALQGGPGRPQGLVIGVSPSPGAPGPCDPSGIVSQRVEGVCV